MRSRLSLLVAVVTVGLLLTVDPAAGQQRPTLSVSPECGPVATGRQSTTVTLSGSNWGEPVYLYFDGQLISQFQQPVQPTNGAFSVPFSFRPTESRYYSFTAQGARSEVFVSDSYSAPCRDARVVLRPPCGPPSRLARITVEGHDFPPNADAEIVWDVNGAATTTGTGTDDTGFFSEVLSVSTPTGNYVVEGNDYGVYGVSARATYQVPCPPPTSSSTTTTEASTTTQTGSTTTVPSTSTTTTATSIPPPTEGTTLAVSPPVGPAGSVVRARGTGFAPGPVTLTWAPGIGVTAAEAGLDGTFETQVLVFPRDVLGPRTLVASGTSTTATASFLVVPNTMQPSGREVAQIVRLHQHFAR